jgi:hypothetical protein
MIQMRGNKKSFLLLILILLGISTSLFPESIALAASQNKRLYIDFENGSFSDTLLAKSYQSMQSFSFNKDPSNYLNGTISSYTINVNGSNVKTCSSSCGSTITGSFIGNTEKVYAQDSTNPGHQIYRVPNGLRWEHKGEKSPIFQFDSPNSAPGLIPEAGYIRQPNEAFPDTAPTPYNGFKAPGNDLRYSAGVVLSDALDFDPKPTMDGAAVTRSYDAQLKSSFRTTKSDAIGKIGPIITNDKVDMSTLILIGASQTQSLNGIEPYFWGNKDGKNEIAVRRILDVECAADPISCHVEVPPDDPTIVPRNYGELDNYVMEVATDWEANTYTFVGYVDITYVPPLKPDLKAIEIKPSASCVEVGQTINLQYSYKNIGPHTAVSFSVEFKSNGSLIGSPDTVSGASNGVLLGKTVYHTFTSTAPVDFMLVVDPMNAIGEDPETLSNNSISLTVTPQASCSGGGHGCPAPFTGTIRTEKPMIAWKQYNVVFGKLSDTSVDYTYRFRFKQNGDFVDIPSSGWYTKHGTEEDQIFQYSSSGYPGSLQSGNVDVEFVVKDTSGCISVIPGATFTIGANITNPPTLDVAWYKASNPSVPVSEVVQGEQVIMKAINIHDSDPGDIITLQWDFTKSTPWMQGLPATYGWPIPLKQQQYAGITASVKGAHQTCVRATDSDGSSSPLMCAFLDVIGPDPKAVIDIGGWLKEGRRIELSGEQSSSPKGSALTYMWTVEPVIGQTLGTMGDIQYISPLSGKFKDFKTSKQGTYQVTLKVIDNEGLTGTTFKIIEVAPDLPPIVDIDGNSVATRQWLDRGLGTFTIVGTATSPDQDIIAKRYWSFAYDANNNGVFDEQATSEIDEDALVVGWEYPYSLGTDTLIITNLGGHSLLLKGEHVGKYLTQLRAVEIPDQPTDLIH